MTLLSSERSAAPPPAASRVADGPMRGWQTPPIEVILIDRPDAPSIGAGEGSVGPASAALANAVANATGRRVRDLPLSPSKVRGLDSI